ncbi:MAG TPA: TIGR02466 family protein [Haliangiales bacterium]|nr:TIGR02466 family protein [Haliangiales bacterium]
MSPGAVDHVALFATPVVAADLDGAETINRELTELLLAEANSSPGLRRSNVGGWHSERDLHSRPEPCYGVVLEAVVARVDELVARLAAAAGVGPVPRYRHRLEAWAMVMRAGDYVILHDHGDAHFSAVYWVDTGDDSPEQPESGRMVLVDPRRGVRPIPQLEVFSPHSTVKPHAGSYLVFPGWLQHYVHPYRGERPRISISCNVVLDPPPCEEKV